MFRFIPPTTAVSLSRDSKSLLSPTPIPVSKREYSKPPKGHFHPSHQQCPDKEEIARNGFIAGTWMSSRFPPNPLFQTDLHMLSLHETFTSHYLFPCHIPACLWLVSRAWECHRSLTGIFSNHSTYVCVSSSNETFRKVCLGKRPHRPGTCRKRGSVSRDICNHTLQWTWLPSARTAKLRLASGEQRTQRPRLLGTLLIHSFQSLWCSYHGSGTVVGTRAMVVNAMHFHPSCS